MTKTRTYRDDLGTKCSDCGRPLVNPGNHRASVFCCGRYRTWYDCREVTLVWDDGRDAQGRFHHPRALISRETVVTIPGGR